MDACPVSAEERETYESLAWANGASLFVKREWTQLFGEDLVRIGLFDKSGQMRGGFHVYCERRFGLTFLRDAPYTPESGPFLSVRAERPVAVLETWREALTAMAAYLRRLSPALTHLSLSQQVIDGLPFRWKGFKLVPAYTYVLDLGLSTQELQQRLTATRRNDISKGLRDGLEVRLVTDKALVRQLVLTSIEASGGDPKVKHLDRILGEYATAENSYGFATFRGSDALACVWVVHDGLVAFHLLGGTVKLGGHRGAHALALWEAIKHAQELGIARFDFEGSVIPPIESYFRGFGGELRSYLTISRGWWPVELVLKSRYRDLF